MPAPLRFFSATLVLTTGALLGGCSQQAPATTTPNPELAAPKETAKFPYGAKIDSLNGVAGHTFGQPVSAFPKMEMFPVEPNELTRSYHASKQVTSGWFAKHRREVPSQFYYFLDGQFCLFRAFGDAATLKAEAEYLFGPGLQQESQLFWEGARARAVYSEQARGFGREGRLDVLSKPLEAAKHAKAKARLKAENTQ
jgi:hypothetical protein